MSGKDFMSKKIKFVLSNSLKYLVNPMKMKFYTIVFLYLFSSIICNSQEGGINATLIEKVQKEEGKYIIPYEKYKLDNGLTFIIHEDHSDPLVIIEVFYHVGSTRDEPGRSGFAHFFEHMMFEGSEHVAPGEHFKIINDAGGICNGNTTYDRTEYFETVPSNYLETALWLEADRMGFFLDAISAGKFEIQRATVKNERGQTDENKPYGLINEKISTALYSLNDPYFAPVIGFNEDIDRADINELKRFFLRWYCPNNATIVIAGDVNPQDAVKLVQKYFGAIHPGNPIQKLTRDSVKMESDRYISYEDNIRNPDLEMVYPTVPGHHKDEVALDILADIIGGEGSSLLSVKLLGSDKPIGSYVEASHPRNEAKGMFRISIKLRPKEELSDAEEIVRKVFRDFEKRGVKDDDILYFKSHYRKEFLDRIETIKDKAFWLGYYQCLYGNPNLFQSEYERYMAVNAKDIMDAFEKYIKNKHCIILSVYPKGSSKNVAQKDNFTVPKRSGIVPEESAYKNLVYKKPDDNFDRSKRPVPGPVPIIKTPDIWHHQFQNGLKVYGINDESIPRIVIKISVDAGHSYEPVDKAGIGLLVSRMFNESTTDYSGYYYMTELQEIGSEIYVEKNTDDLDIVIKSTRDNLFRTFTLLEEKMFSLKFDDYEFKWEKNRFLDHIGLESKSASTIADNVFMKLIYGENSIFGFPLYGTSSTIKNISNANVKKYYKENFNAANSNIVVVGDIKKEDIIHKLEFLSNWENGVNKKNKVNESEELHAIGKTRLYFISKENAPQSEIRIGKVALKYDPLGEQFKCTIMNFPLGDGMNSRINHKLREVDGFTYAAMSMFHASKYTGQFIVKTSVNAKQTDSAVMEIMNEIKRYADQGITEDELQQTRKSFYFQHLLKSESTEEKCSYLWRLLYYNLKPDYLNQQQALLSSITKAEIDGLAKKYLTCDNMCILVVGDKSLIPALKKLPYYLIEIDSNGNVVQ